MNSVGFKIKRLRERKNISQEEFAYKLDISQGTLSKIENGVWRKLIFFLCKKFVIILKLILITFWMISYSK
jgi:transcriptional regulator with XRE-family HTH domain